MYFNDTTGSGGDQDVLITPMVNGVSDGSVNGTANAVGVTGSGPGNTVSTGEALRVDFVAGISGNPKTTGGLDYGDLPARDHAFTSHNVVNAAAATFVSTTGSKILIKAFDDLDTDNILGDGYGVMVSGVVTGTEIAVITDDGFTTLEYHYDSGDGFMIGGFGASTFEPGEAVDLSFDLALVDGDGDSVLIPDGLQVNLSPDDHDIYMGTDGDDVLDLSDGQSGTLVGLLGDDILTGDDGNDILIGGDGDDEMTGGEGSDTFVWNADETGIDTITDFEVGVDRLDLADILIGESGDADSIGNLLEHIAISTESGDTVIKLSAEGAFVPGEAPDAGAVDQTIVLQGVDLLDAYGGDVEAAILGMLGDDTLNVDRSRG